MDVVVVGASGFVGQELVRVLARHPVFEPVAFQAHQRAGRRLGELVPGLSVDLAERPIEPIDPGAVAAELAFCALPHGHSGGIVRELRARGVRVVDLGADLRLADEATWRRWYGDDHPAPELLGSAVVGVAEHVRTELASARVWAVPGCYVTATVLAAKPLIDAGLARRDLVVVDAISGVTGAGSAATETTHFVNVAEGVRAYALGGHRHTPEMRSLLGVPVRFTPHLGPYSRGIAATLTLPVADATVDADSVRDVLARAYGTSPFVEVRETPPSTREVRGSNRAVLAATVDDEVGVIVATSVIDNLGKGAAQHAVQGANLMVGVDEVLGLEGLGVWP